VYIINFISPDERKKSALKRINCCFILKDQFLMHFWYFYHSWTIQYVCNQPGLPRPSLLFLPPPLPPFSSHPVLHPSSSSSGSCFLFFMVTVWCVQEGHPLCDRDMNTCIITSSTTSSNTSSHTCTLELCFLPGQRRLSSRMAELHAASVSSLK